MKNLNTKTVSELATMLKVEPSVLSEQLTTEQTDETKMETKIGEVLPKLTIMPTIDFNTLVENTGKQKYKEGKIAESEMSLKEQRKKFGFDESVNSLDSLIAKAVEAEVQKSGTPTDARVKEYEKEKAALQTLVRQREEELAKVKGEVDEVKTNFTISNQIEKAIMEIPIDVDATKLNGQREILATIFKQKHTIKVEDGKQVVYRDGNKLVDGLMNPVSVQDALKDFAPAYVNVKASIKGRGDEASNLQLSGDIAGITDRKSFEAYMAKKGIKDYSSPEGIAIYREIKAKNPALKF
jgi:hypothetical protein